MTRTSQAVVLAGGAGTRLGDLTAETPKPLLPVGGRPFLDWVLAKLARHGIDDVIVTAGYRAGAFEPWRKTVPTSLRVRVFEEDTPLGTGGALPRIGDWLDPSFFVLNGDTILDVAYDRLDRLREETASAGAIALRWVDDASRYGRVLLEGDRVAGFSEKARGGEGLVNGGVYCFDRSILEGIRGVCSIETDLLPDLVARNLLTGLPVDGFFVDIGIPSSYEDAQTSVPAWWSESGA